MVIFCRQKKTCTILSTLCVIFVGWGRGDDKLYKDMFIYDTSVLRPICQLHKWVKSWTGTYKAAETKRERVEIAAQLKKANVNTYIVLCHTF